MNKFYLAVLFSLTLSVNAQEVSVFGAGDLNAPEPYGLTPTEKAIVENKKALKEADKKIGRYDSKIQELSESLEGLKSVIEGESKKLNDLSIDINQQTSQLQYDREKAQSNETLLQSIQAQLEQNRLNIESLKQSMDGLAETINKINKEYVSRDDFKELIGMIDKKEKVKTATSSKASEIPKKSHAQLMQDVREWFKKDYFTKAIPVIEYLIEKNYRPAENNYYLGEINYYRENYKDALHYFKTSMMLYDKADWLPKLLLHSAISFEKLGDTQNAKSFYTTLVDIYPESPEAKEASKKIK